MQLGVFNLLFPWNFTIHCLRLIEYVSDNILIDMFAHVKGVWTSWAGVQFPTSPRARQLCFHYGSTDHMFA